MSTQYFKFIDRWVLYGGDVSQDGIVDSGDMILMDNNSSTFVGSVTP